MENSLLSLGIQIGNTELYTNHKITGGELVTFIMYVSLARPQQIDEHTEVGINHGYL